MARRIAVVLSTLLAASLLVVVHQTGAAATTVGNGEKLLLKHLAAADWYGSGTMHLSECTSPASGCGPDRYPSADLVEQDASFTIAPNAEGDYYYTDGYNPAISIVADGVLNRTQTRPCGVVSYVETNTAEPWSSVSFDSVLTGPELGLAVTMQVGVLRHDRGLDCSGQFDSEDGWVYGAGVYPSEDLLASGQDMPWFQPVRVAGGWALQGTQHNVIVEPCCLNTRWEWTITLDLRCDDPCVKPVELTAMSCGADPATGTLTPSLDLHRIIPASGEDRRAQASTRTFAVSADGSTTLVGSGWAGGAGGVLLEWDFQGGRMSHLTADGPLTDSRNPGGALTPGARYKVEVTAFDVGTQVGDQVSLLCTAPAVVDCAPEAAGASTYDVDGDRLPDVYEKEILGTDPTRPDTDCDGASDPVEVASGSSPTDPAQTPNTLPGGKPATKIDGRGDAGVTCGTTKFEWRTPALDELGVPQGKRGCILLLSNDTANAVIDFVLKHDKASVTTALAKFAGDHLGEVYGDETVDWTAEYKFDRKLKKAKRQAKKALYRAFNLTRINSFFLAGRVAGLHGVAMGAVWALNQIRNNDACVQVRIAEGKTGRYRLSWSLVYSRDQLTKAGLKDDLHYAGTWRRNEKRFALDEAVRANTNLTCDRGDVRATGGGASEVFNDAVSFVF